VVDFHFQVPSLCPRQFQSCRFLYHQFPCQSRFHRIPSPFQCRYPFRCHWFQSHLFRNRCQCRFPCLRSLFQFHLHHPYRRCLQSQFLFRLLQAAGLKWADSKLVDLTLADLKSVGSASGWASVSGLAWASESEMWTWLGCRYRRDG